ncbi:MAG: transglutaminase family protein [Deltaproteobacteria bacterium]|nr:transglutaminase family protein [Deltaproteobacteria bacterium]
MRFEEFAQQPDDGMDLLRGAVLVAAELEPSVDVEAVVAAVKALGEPLAARRAALDAMPIRSRCEEVGVFFSKTLGFKGNTESYDDPSNSFLHQVLARRTGIPITLSIVWCEVARHAGLTARGVSFPGHFLVRVDDEGGEPILVDPFGDSRLVDEETAKQIFDRAVQGRAPFGRRWFAPAPPRQILFRMFSNLHARYSPLDPSRAFVCADRKLMLVPDSRDALRERATLAMRLGAADTARSDIDRLVELDPTDDTVPLLRARLARLTSTPPPRKPLH